MSKYGHLMLLGAFPEKIARDLNFTDEAVVQFDVVVIKMLL